jgi:cell division protein ZipA
MNELRWILLAAGVVLIVGLYLWGMRSRWQGRGGLDTSRRPAVFSGGAKGFETSPDTGHDDDTEADGPVVPRVESRRIEPSFDAGVVDVEVDQYDEPASQRANALDDEEALERPAIGRREPTMSTSRTESSNAPARQEPTLQPDARLNRRAEPTVATTPESPRRPSQKILAIRVTAIAPARFDGAELRESLLSESLSFGRYEIFHRLHDDGRPVFSVASLKEPGTFDIEAMPETQYPGVAMFAVLPGPLSAADAFDEMIFTARALATHLNGALADERGAPLTALRVGKLREEALDFERTCGLA